MGKSNVSVTVSYLRYIFQMSILPYLSDTGAMYLEYLTEDTFKSIFPNPASHYVDLFMHALPCRRKSGIRGCQCHRTRCSRCARFTSSTLKSSLHLALSSRDSFQTIFVTRPAE